MSLRNAPRGATWFEMVVAAIHGVAAPIRLGAGLPEGDLEVLVQNTFVRAFSPSARAAYDGLRPFGSYLVTIARNLLIDEARARNRERRVETVADIDAVVGIEPQRDPTERLHAEQLAQP